MATLANVLSFSRAQAQTDSNGLTDANGIIFANEALVDFHRRLSTHGVDASQTQEAYVNTVTVPASGNGSTFLYPTDMLALKTIEVNFAGSNPQDFKEATQIDVSNIHGRASFSWLRANQSNEFPLFDDRGDQYEIFPAFTGAHNLTNAIRLFYYLKPTEYTATGDTISYPESLDIRILGWRIASDYYYSLNKMVEGDMFNAKYEERVMQYIESLARGSQQPIQPQILNVGSNGWDF